VYYYVLNFNGFAVITCYNDLAMQVHAFNVTVPAKGGSKKQFQAGAA
jgi:hypothetical protein